jgi:peptide/nickel transport system substrate-binding protein
MNKRFMLVFVSLLMVMSMLLASCTPAKPTAPAAAAPFKMGYEEPKFAPLKMEAPNCDYGGNLKAVETVDENTVKFSLCKPDPAFLAKIAVPAFTIYDKGFLDSTGGDAAKINEMPVGSGPYYLKEWVRGDHLTFEVNPLYWGEKPANKTFILKWNAEAAARLLDLQSGNIDGMDNIGTDDYATVTGDANLQLAPRKFNNFLYLGLNNKIPPFDNIKVRQAFAMAVNKEAIVKDFYPAGARAADQFLPPLVKPGYTDGYKSPSFDQVKAKQMLTDAGFDFNKEYTLSYAERTRPYFPQPTKIAQAVQAQLAEIGVKIKLNLMEWAAYLPKVRAGEEALFFLGWSEDYPDATNWYDVFLMGSSLAFGDPYAGEMEQIKIGATSGDVAVRQAAYDKLNKLIDEDVPCIVIANGATALAFSSKVSNVVIGPYNENFTAMKKEGDQIVFSQDGEPVSLDCADETDGSSFRACMQIFDTLYNFKYGSAELQPALAEKCEANADATAYTCTLRKGAKFQNGASLDAADVVASFSRAFDYKDANHKGNTGVFQYFKDFFGPVSLNEPPAQ